jgi:hypothetical protein
MEQSSYINFSDELRLSSQKLSELMNEVLLLGLPFRFRAGGGSMYPFIHDGDVLSITPLEGRRPGFGDVVAFRRDSIQGPDSARLVVHRVVKTDETGCFLLGDNQLPDEMDGPIPPDQLLGAASKIERQGKIVRLGLGPERFLIAAALRLGLLRPNLRLAARLRRAISRLPQSVRTGKRS